MYMLDVIGLFLLLSGFVVGLGAVTVIDIHGLLGTKSSYWTEATIRTHKVTKPLIWLGVFLVIVGGFIFYRNEPLVGIPLFHACVVVMLLVNGMFLSFTVSPYLLQREREGKASEILPVIWQRRIAVSLLFSDAGWWISLFLLAVYITERFA
jgi:hypothetical protein